MPSRSIGKEITFIARYLSRYIDIQTAHLRLSSATVPFITYLYDNDGVHQDEMAESLQFDKSSAARAVRALEQRGYVTRSVDAGNKRRNIVTVTPRGIGIRDELRGILKQCTQRLFSGFSDTDIDRYFRFTETLNQNLRTMMNEQKRNR